VVPQVIRHLLDVFIYLCTVLEPEVVEVEVRLELGTKVPVEEVVELRMGTLLLELMQ
jgi:hypothetical protein